MATPESKLMAALKDDTILLDLFIESEAEISIFNDIQKRASSYPVLEAKAFRSQRTEWIKQAVTEASIPEPIDEAVIDELARERYSISKEKYRKPEKRKFSHILVSQAYFSKRQACDCADEDQPSNIDELLALLEYKIGLGYDFSELASKYSSDFGTARRGGSLGNWVAKNDGQLVKEFADAGFRIPAVGQVVGPVQTRFGYHFIRLDERLSGDIPPYSEVAENIKNLVRRDRVDSAKTSYLSSHYPNPSDLNKEQFRSLIQEVVNTIRSANQTTNIAP